MMAAASHMQARASVETQSLAQAGSAAESDLEFGELRVETQGFFREKGERPSGATSLFVNPDWWTEGTLLSARLNVQAVTLLTDRSTFTVESSDAYISTSRQWVRDHQLTLGRRVYDWSVADQRWGTGMWSPRFNWDPIRPQTVGLLGLFYTYENRDWRIIAYASPVSVPERGFPIAIEDGKLRSSSPDFVPPFSQVSLMGQSVDIKYNLVYPDMLDLLVVPAAAFSVRHGDPREEGLWAQASVSSKAMNQIELLLEPELIASQLILNSNLHPRRLRHGVATLESGWNLGWMHPWLSLSAERPEALTPPEGWVGSAMGPALVTAAGLDFSFPTGNVLGAQWINVQESLPALASSGGMAGVTPSRFQYKDALRFRASWEGPSRFDYVFGWTHDLNWGSSLLTADIGYKAFRRLHLGLGADFFSAAQGEGFIGQYYGNDRVRAKVSYAF